MDKPTSYFSCVAHRGNREGVSTGYNRIVLIGGTMIQITERLTNAFVANNGMSHIGKMPALGSV